jgi:hypothetical protein
MVPTRRSATLALALVFALLGALLAATAVSGAAANTVELHTDLNGAEEAPNPGDPDGSGEATLKLVPQLGLVCYVLYVNGIAPATAAHIHVGEFGVAGPVVVTLKAPTRGASAGCTTVSPSLVQDIAENPTAYYVNVHNADFPSGALRGQLGD